MNNVAKVARECGVNDKTVHRWVQRHAETGNVCARKPGGRRKVINGEVASMAVQLLLDPMTLPRLQLLLQSLRSKVSHRVHIMCI